MCESCLRSLARNLNVTSLARLLVSHPPFSRLAFHAARSENKSGYGISQQMQYPSAMQDLPPIQRKNTKRRRSLAASSPPPGNARKNNKGKKTRLRNQYSGGDGYRARAVAYSLGCFFEAFAFKALVLRLVSFCPRTTHATRFANHHHREIRESSRGYLRDLLLRPLEIVAHLARVLEPLREPRARLGQPRLRLCLQLEELAVLGVEVAGSVFPC